MQRNRYYSPRSTAWASEGERSHAGLKVFETRCQGAILHVSLAENVLSGDKNRRYVSRNLTAGRTLLSSLYVCSGRNWWKKVSSRKLFTYRRYLSMLSIDFNRPMTCGFVCENRMICMNRGQFEGLRQKIGNDRALTIVGDCQKTPPNEKRAPRAI